MPNGIDLAAGLTSLKAALDLAKAFIGLTDRVAVREKSIELQEKIIAGLESQAAMMKRVSELEKEVTDLKAWGAEKQNYELKEVGHRGALVYALKESVKPSGVSHYLCTKCYQDGVPSILQKETRVPNLSEVLVCPNCLTDFFLTGERDPQHATPKTGSHRPRRN